MSAGDPGTKTVLWHLANIVQTEMGLSSNQVWIYNQKRNIPPSRKFWIVIDFLSGKPFGSKSKFVPTEDGANEVQTINMSAIFVVDIFSRDTSALEIKEQVVMAFRSIYAQQTMEKYSFLIGRIPVSFTNLSQVEGTAILYRFQIGLRVQYVYQLTRGAEYYDSFTDSITTEA
jgi:hypothetical protein